MKAWSPVLFGNTVREHVFAGGTSRLHNVIQATNQT